MIHTAVIAAAGKGTRMLDLAKDIPKHMIHVEGKPFLFYVLSNLKEAGITEMILVVGHKKEKIEEFVREYSNEFSITLVDQFEQVGNEKYGTVCPIEAVKDVIGNQPFISIYGDNIYSSESIKKLMRNDEYTYVAGLVHKNPELYGSLVQKGEFLEQIIEKAAPEIAKGHLVNIGLYLFTAEIFDMLPKVEKSIRGEYELTDAISLLAHEGKVKVVELTDTWLDFGRPEDVEIVSKYLQNNE